MALVTVLIPKDRAEYESIKGLMDQAGIKGYDEIGTPLEELVPPLDVPLQLKIDQSDLVKLANALALLVESEKKTDKPGGGVN